MGTYDICKSVTLRLNPWADEGSFVTKLSAGMASGMMGAAIANPADLVSFQSSFVVVPVACPLPRTWHLCVHYRLALT
jgi:hypothetical protein